MQGRGTTGVKINQQKVQAYINQQRQRELNKGEEEEEEEGNVDDEYNNEERDEEEEKIRSNLDNKSKRNVMQS